MKKFILIVVLIISSCILVGCGDKNLPQPSLQRDKYGTGGNLTFVYDETSKVASFGGEGEVVQYYLEDIAKGWKEKGCRVGVQMLLPKEVKEYKSGTAKVNGKKMTANDYIKLSEEQNLVATFFPLVDENHRDVTIKVKWQDDKNEQVYHIVIKEGTIFMSEDDLVR